MNTLVSLAIAIAAGLLMSRVIRLIKLPNVTAYLIAGLLIGPSIAGLLTKDMIEGLDVITNVALGFIAYSIGGEFKLSYLKQIGSKPIIITLFEGLTAVVLVDGVLIVMGFPLPMCLMLGAIAAATAPAATLMVVRQYKAKGEVCSMLLPVVAMDDALCLMAFAISSAIARALESGSAITVMNMFVLPMLQIVESLALGFGIGLVLVFAARFFKSRGNKLALTIMAVFLGVGLSTVWDLSALLVCMMIGAAMINLSKDTNVLVEQCDRFTPPIFLLFFVLSGAGLDLSVLPSVGVIGVTYILVRSFGKWLGASLGAKVSHAGKNVEKYLGLTLLPQAGVAIGMARLAMSIMPEYGAQINTVILSGTLIYELLGPVITKLTLLKAGEIKPEAPAKKLAAGKS